MPENNLPAVVFYGTPEFAVPSLDILVKNNFPVKAVVTAPDKPSGRGLKLQPSPIKQYAISHGIPVLQPESLKDTAFLSELKSLNPELQVVVAFRKLPEMVWKLPVLGTFNLHASLLPDYRGAAPINWSLINGDLETGLTTFLINENIDTGSLLYSIKVPISINDNAGILHDRLMDIGSKLVLRSALSLAQNKIMPVIQPLTNPDGSPPRPAPKIFKDNCRISWDKSNIEIFNLIRGLSPYPGAFSELVDEQGNCFNIKIYSVRLIDTEENAEPGTILTDNKTYWKVACKPGWVELINLQLPGKKALNINDLLNGFPLTMNWRFKV